MFVDMIMIAIVTALACATIGLFLVVRGVALMSDAIGHAVIFGIVISYLLFHSLNTALLMGGAVGTGVLTVCITELLIATKRIYKEVAVGLVFPFLFSIGSLLVCQYTAALHLDIDMVLLGEITLASLKRLSLYGIDCGPFCAWLMGVIAVTNLTFIWIFREHLQIALFDPCLAQLYHMHPQRVYYALIVLSSITIVGALEIVGSLVVVALMIVPGATALLHLCTMQHLLYGTALYACLGVGAGCAAGYLMDISIGGAIAVSCGLLFFGQYCRTRIYVW